MKLNWGTGLVIVLAFFIIGMGTVTYKAMNQRHDLVTTDYYQKEIAYQGTIDAKKNAESLGENCRFETVDGKLNLLFPEALAGQSATAEIELYYPTMAERDFSISKADWAIQGLEIPEEKLASGKWIAKVALNAEGKDYYFETETLLP